MQAPRGAWGACQRPEPPLRCHAIAWRFSIAVTWVPGFVSPLSPSSVSPSSVSPSSVSPSFVSPSPLLRRPLSPSSVSPIWFAGRAPWPTADHRWPPLGPAGGVLPARVRSNARGWAWMGMDGRGCTAIRHAGCYIYSSCCRIILLGYSQISILKTAPNRRFGGFFRLQTPLTAL
jgi:hypothetical protein